MTKYNVKIYQSEELVDEQILEENDVIELADMYAWAGEHWKNLCMETDEGEIDIDSLGITIYTYAEFEEGDGTVRSVIEEYGNDNEVVEAYPQVYLQHVNLIEIQGIDAEHFLDSSDVAAAEEHIADEIDLPHHFEHIFVKVEIRKIENRRGIPKEIADQFPEEVVAKVEKLVREQGVDYVDYPAKHLKFMLELANRNLSFENCIELPEIKDRQIATILSAADHGYDIMSRLETKNIQYDALDTIDLIAAALDGGHFEILDRFDRMNHEECCDLLEALKSNQYHPIFLDERFLESAVTIEDVRDLIQAGSSFERVQELLDKSSSSKEFKAIMMIEEFTRSDLTLSNKLIDHLKETAKLAEIESAFIKYRMIFRLMKNNSIDADELLKISDRLTTYPQLIDLVILYDGGVELFKYIPYDRMTKELNIKEVALLIRKRAFKPLESFRDSSEYSWVLNEPELCDILRLNSYEKIEFAFDDSLSSAESRAIIKVIHAKRYESDEIFEEIKELINNRSNLDKSFIEALISLVV